VIPGDKAVPPSAFMNGLRYILGGFQNCHHQLTLPIVEIRGSQFARAVFLFVQKDETDGLLKIRNVAIL
jgi:hypothetical protein